VESGGGSILCIDDEAVILLAMKQELRRRYGARYAIETALGAEAAQGIMDRLESEGKEVALVICDWFMPGIKGDRFLAALHARRPATKSILLTGQADEDAIRRVSEEAGISACVRKPWRSDELARAIDACLDRR
jgi:response regulator RpfG family c-di-GMP phosphodiesterase